MNTFQEIADEFEKLALADVTNEMERAHIVSAFWHGAMALFRLQAHIAETMSQEAMHAITPELFKEVNAGALTSILKVLQCNGVGVQILDVSKLFNDKPTKVKPS